MVERYRIGVGPATVRHELAEMSERGYLEQPHTSAGRIPSDIGYRYYVDKLSEPSPEPKAEKQVREISRGEAALDDLLLETCRVLSRLTQYVSVAATAGDKSLSIRSVAVTGVTRERVLVSVVLSNGIVENRIIPATSDLTLADLHDVSFLLSKATAQLKLRSVNKSPMPAAEHLKPHVQELASSAWKALKSVCRSLSSGRVLTEGTQYLVEHPEFQQDVKSLATIVHALEDSETIFEALEPTGQKQTAITIGRENTADALQRLAIIAGRFYIGDEEAGAIAVAGPTRMRYASTVPLVETAAKALTDALNRLMK